MGTSTKRRAENKSLRIMRLKKKEKRGTACREAHTPNLRHPTPQEALAEELPGGALARAAEESRDPASTLGMGGRRTVQAAGATEEKRAEAKA